MECKCPSCSSVLIKKNGHIHNGKQNYRFLKCSRQFVLEPTQKIIDEKTKDLIKRVLLERISLEKTSAQLRHHQKKSHNPQKQSQNL